MGRFPTLDSVDGPHMVLATTPDGVPDAPSLEDLLGPPPRPEWVDRYGVERMWAFGSWLRRVHDSPASAAKRSSSPHADDEPIEPLPKQSRRDSLRESVGVGGAHDASLATWAALLRDGDHLGHGHLGLDLVFPEPAEQNQRWVVEAVGGLSLIHPAVDVGAVTGDLVELTHRARLHGHDAAVFERLLSAFLTGYRGFTSSGNVADLSVYRAAALRVALHARTHDDPDDRWLCGQLTCRLVEHCWSLSADSG